MNVLTRPPAWARWFDRVSIATFALAGLVALAGGVRLRAGFMRLSLTSPGRLVLVAVALTVLRHVVAPAVPIYRDLPPRLRAWMGDTFVDDLDCRSERPLTVALFFGLIAAFSALALAMTYPLALRISDSLFDPGDPLLNLWTLRWVAHQVVTSPVHLFDGNIFAPERNTLAYSETLLAPGLLAAPLTWFGAGGILVHNVVFLAGFAASGVAMAVLVRELTGRISAGIVSGIAFAFLPFRFDHFAQLQLQHAEWIPLTFWALHRVVRTGRIRDGVWLGVSIAAQLMSCMYYGMFLALYLTAAGCWILAWRCSRWRSWSPPLAVSLVVAFALFLPAARAYIDARSVVGERSRQENISFSATWSNYLAAPDTNRIYGRTAEQYGGLEKNLFPGLVVLALAAAALWPPLSVVRTAYAVGLVIAVDLTLGFNGLLYPTLYATIPPFRALRIPALAVVLVGFSLSVLAGFAVARLRLRRLAPIAGAAILLESFSLPMPLTRLTTTPPEAYTDLVRDAAGLSTIVELPIIYSRDPRYQDQIYMYYSTFHWHTLVNGYSGFFPPPYLEAAAVMRTFPDPRSLALLRGRNVRYIVVHGERMTADDYARIVAATDSCGCGLRLLSRRPWQNREISVYRLP